MSDSVTRLWPVYEALDGGMLFEPALPQARVYVSLGQIAAYVQGSLPVGTGITELTGDVVAGPGSGAQAATLANTAVAPGNYTLASITVDGKGRITAASNGASSGITQLTGDVLAGPGSDTQAATLATTGVAAGSYTAANITVDGKGRLTAAANGTALTDAPSDGTSYGRRNGAWASVAPILSPTFLGTPTAPTPAPGTSNTTIATTAFVAASALPSGTTHDQLVYVGGAWTAQRPKYVVSAFVPGALTASQLLLLHPCTKAITIPANLGAYLGHATAARGTVNATGSTTVIVQKAVAASPGTFTNVGTIVVSASAMVATTFTTTSGAAVTFAQGDTLALVAPASPDATLANFSASLVGFET